MAKPRDDREQGRREQGGERPQTSQQEQRERRSMARPSPTSTAATSWPLARLRSEFDRAFNDFFRGWGGLPALEQEMGSGWGLDIDEEEDKIVVRAEAPGFEPQDFDLEVRQNELVLCACQSEESEQDGGRRWQRRELHRTVPLPPGIDEEHVDAQYRNGILTVTLPKTEKSQRRRIDVKG